MNPSQCTEEKLRKKKGKEKKEDEYKRIHSIQRIRIPAEKHEKYLCSKDQNPMDEKERPQHQPVDPFHT